MFTALDLSIGIGHRPGRNRNPPLQISSHTFYHAIYCYSVTHYYVDVKVVHQLIKVKVVH